MRLLLLFAACLSLATPALARDNHAILIGANSYPALDERWWLKGPGNDVALVARYLTTAAPVAFAPGNVVMLTDADGGQPPTLAAIRAAFADLAARVAPGDFVYLHFSGHGTQAPAADAGAELDGLDELFLPVDIGPWNDSTGTVANALVDDEIGAMIDALRQRGADVWAVFDSCHSGTATRAAPFGDDAVRTRQLPPAALGVPEPEAANALPAPEATRALPDPRARPEAPLEAGGAAPGSLVAFFAAQTNEVTPEKNLPKGKPGRVPQGVFTYTLFETLAANPGATYAQLGQEVLRRYAVTNLARSTPLFEGDLNRVAFSGEAGSRVAQWPGVAADGSFTLPAGTLHGLSAGSLLAVLETATDATDRALGYVQVTGADTFSASAAPVDHAGKVLSDDLPDGLTLRKVSPDLDFTLTVALPEPGSAPAAALTAAMPGLAAEQGARLVFVAPGAAADLRLAVLPDSPRPDALWLLPATGLAEGDLARIPSVSTSDKTAAELATAMGDLLGRMTRALNLLKLGGSLGGGDLNVDVRLLTRDPVNRTLRDLPVAAVPRLVPDDEVHVVARNNMDLPLDVNVLYVGADFSITHMFAGRLQPGDTLKQGLLRITDTSFGRDRVVIVMAPAAPQTAVESLEYLAQDALDLTRQIGPGLGAALREAGFGTTTRAATSLAEEVTGPAPAILQFDLDTVPAE